MKSAILGLISAVLVSTWAVAANAPAPAPAAVSRAFVTEMFTKMFIENQYNKLADVYMASDFIEHEPTSTNGTKALRAYLDNFNKQHPQAVTTIRRVLADGDLAAVYFQVQYSATDKGILGVDIFRFADGKAVEHWGITQTDQEPWESSYTTADPNPTAAQTAKNKALVKEMFQRLFVENRALTEADKYIAKDFIEHSPVSKQNGVEGLKAYFKVSYKENPKQAVEVKRVITDGNFAIVNFHYKPTPEERGFAGCDIFRIENGMIAEHWDAVQPVPEKSANDNTMF